MVNAEPFELDTRHSVGLGGPADVLCEPGGRIDAVLVDRAAARVHLEVQVASGRVAQVTDLADLLPGGHGLTVRDARARACARTRW